MANYGADSADSEAAIDSADSEADNVEEGIETRDVHDLETEAACDISTTHGLYEGSLISTKATLALLTQLAQRHRLSKSALCDFMKVISVLLPQQPDVLKSGFHFNKAVINLTTQLAKPIVHYLCPCCKSLMKEKSTCLTAGCLYSGVEEPLYFFELPIENQIQALFADHPEFYKSLEINFGRRHGCVTLSDVYDGQVYQSLVESGYLQNIFHLTLGMNTDGVQLFKSPQTSMWPVYFRINELPPTLRSSKKYLLLAAVWCRQEKPPMHWFLRPVIDRLNRLYTEDLPAKALLLHCQQYNGCFGCSECEIKGQVVPRLRGHTTSFWQQSLAIKRTHKSVCHQAQVALQTNKVVVGVKGYSPLSWLDEFDVVKQTPIDYMHCVLLGVTKMLLNLWFNSRNKTNPYYIGHHTGLIDERLSSIFPPTEISRKPGLISKMSDWKASQYRAFLLYYMVPVLADVLDQQYWIHAFCLASALHSLLSSSITADDLLVIDQSLNQFVTDMKLHYGLEYCSMNVHLLTHLVDHVKLFGPLWTHSCFEFESANLRLRNLVHGKRYPDQQIVNGWHREHCAFNISQESKEVQALHESLSHSSVRSENNCNEVALKCKRKQCLDGDQVSALMMVLGQAPEACELYTRASWSGKTFCSSGYLKSKRMNSVVQFQKSVGTTQFGLIDCFVSPIPSMADFAAALVLPFDARPLAPTGVPLIQQKWLAVSLRPRSDLLAIPIRNIVRKCVYVQISSTRFRNAQSYLSLIPNEIEVD
ncbi:uncharacterized protein LOC134187542 isoform X2 [Corticium candelabrum]|uniref:uncharacterized protein LOC134187542 isoform X2 n=1 Tax=Corticium candelabrum TaxID=121492 RepID=UPI002E25B91D|nr:uncharacterized protein LOC134187542 isoform X2 [Corticium candelabrum]